MKPSSLLLWMSFCVALGCTRQERESVAEAEQSAQWANAVRDAHKRADDATTQTQRNDAITALRNAVQAAPPPNSAKRQWALQDLHFRLAQTLVDDGQLREAQVVIAQGLQLTPEPSVTRANLLALQGKVYELEGKAEQAARALHEALLINEVLLEQALEGKVDQKGNSSTW